MKRLHVGTQEEEEGVVIPTKDLERVDVDTFQEQFDDYFGRVEGGELFVITRDGEDAAVIMPYHYYERLQEEMAEATSLCKLEVGGRTRDGGCSSVG